MEHNEIESESTDILESTKVVEQSERIVEVVAESFESKTEVAEIVLEKSAETIEEYAGVVDAVVVETDSLETKTEVSEIIENNTTTVIELAETSKINESAVNIEQCSSNVGTGVETRSEVFATLKSEMIVDSEFKETSEMVEFVEVMEDCNVIAETAVVEAETLESKSEAVTIANEMVTEVVLNESCEILESTTMEVKGKENYVIAFAFLSNSCLFRNAF